MPPTPSAPSAAPREAKRRRLTVDQTVEARRCRLRTALHAAAVAATAAGGAAATAADALASAAEEHQRQELAFDEGLGPALEFMGVMGVSPAVVFKDVLAELGRQLAEKLRGGRREAVERVLSDMLQHLAVPCIRDLVGGAVQRLSDLPPPGDLERLTLSLLAEAYAKDRAPLEHLPALLQRRIWEAQPQLFFAKVEPLVAEFLRAFRRSFGPLLIELRQRAPERRRAENAALQRLADLVGQQPGLYRVLRRRLLSAFREAAERGAPAARLRPAAEGGGAAEEGEGAPASVGPEPALSTLRSELLLSLVDRQVLRGSLAGAWELKSECDGRPLRYVVTLQQRGGAVSGASELEGVARLEGTFQDSKLVFKQHGEGFTYVCSCDVSPDLLSLSGGRWREERGGAEPQPRGTFSGARLGPVRYADASGEVWDELCALVVALDGIHQRKAALDSSVLPAVQRVARGYAAAAAASAPGAATGGEVAFVLMDPCVVQSLLRGLLSTRSEGGSKAAGSLLSAEVRATLQLLLCAGRATAPRRDPAAGAGQPAPRSLPSGLEFSRLAEALPPQEALAAAGLRGDLLAVALRKHGRKDVDSVVEAGGQLNAELSEALQCAARGPAHEALRLLLNTLTNKCLLFRQHKALKECLQLSQQHTPAPHDWVQLQQVDMLVGTATQLGEWFDVNLRRLVTEHLFPMARQDPWVHYRVAELLAVYQRNIASSREEITALQEVLNNGMLEDSHHKWSRELALVYLPIVQGKSYLLDIYRDSRLGRCWPVEDERLRAAAAAPAAVGPAAAGTSPLHTASPAPTSDAADTTPPAGAGGPAELARRALGSDDGLMSPGIANRVRDFCSETSSPERLAEAVELLTVNFRGYHWLSYLAAKWVAVLGAASSTPQTFTTEGLLRSLLRRKMVAEFDPQKADPLLMPINGTPHMPAWLDPLIQVKEWRGVIYELAKQYRGQASSFLSAVLLQISEAESYKDELLCNTSSTSNFIVFCRTLRSGLTRFFTLLNEDESCVAPAVADICMACSFSEYTYVYAQAVLHHLMHIRPRERPQLRHLSQALAGAAAEKSGNVLQLDLRFTSAGQYPEVFGILYSMCRLGREIRIVPADVVRLCGLVEGLLELKAPRPAAAAALPQSQRSGCDSPASVVPAQRPDGPGAALEAARDSGSEHGTEAMSDVGSWLDPAETELPPTERNAWVGVGSDVSEGEEDGEDGEGRSRRVYVSVASSSAAPGVSSAGGDRSGRRKPQPATEQSERTASIFNMPAVSSAASGAQVAHSETQSGEAGLASSAGIGGVLEALRCPAILEALLARFIDPNHPLSAREHRAFARLLAIATVDDLWPADIGGADKQDKAKAAAAIATAATEELEHVYQVVHNSQHSWLKRMAAMFHLQRYAVSSMASLQWLAQVILSKQVAPSELLVRMSQALLFVLLRRACDAHPPQVRTVLGILRHILEIMPDVVSERYGEDMSGLTMSGTGGQQRVRVHQMVATMLTYLILAHGALMPVLEFVYSTLSSWETAMMQLFATELLTSIQPPYSLRCSWSIARLLAAGEMLGAVADSQRARAAALTFLEALPAPEALAAGTGAQADEARQAELRAAAEAIRARLLGGEANALPQLQGSSACGTSAAAAAAGIVAPAAVATSALVSVALPEPLVDEPPADYEAYSEQNQLWEWWSSSKAQRKQPASAVIHPNRVTQANSRAAPGRTDELDAPSLKTARRGRKWRGSRGSAKSAPAPDAVADDAQPHGRRVKHRTRPRRRPTSSSGSSESKAEPISKRPGSDTDSAGGATEDGGEARDGEDGGPAAAGGAEQKDAWLDSCVQAEAQVPSGGAGVSCSSVLSPLGNADVAMGTPAPKRRLCLRIVPTNSNQTSSEPAVAPCSTPLTAPGRLADPPSTPRASPDCVTSPSSPTLQCPTPAADFELDLAALQGRWVHSFTYLGMLSVKGDAVTFDNGLKFELRVLSRGVVEMSGWMASREQSSGGEIVWTQSGGGEHSICSWRRPAAADQRGRPKGSAQGARPRVARR